MARGSASAIFSRSSPRSSRISCEESLGFVGVFLVLKNRVYNQAAVQAMIKRGTATVKAASVIRISIMKARLKIAPMMSSLDLKSFSIRGVGTQY